MSQVERERISDRLKGNCTRCAIAQNCSPAPSRASKEIVPALLREPESGKTIDNQRERTKLLARES